MYIKLSICGIQHTCSYQFIIFLIITKIECWPVFKQDPEFSMHINSTSAARTLAQRVAGNLYATRNLIACNHSKQIH